MELRAEQTAREIEQVCVNPFQIENKQQLSEVLLNSLPMNGHTLEFCP